MAEISNAVDNSTELCIAISISFFPKVITSYLRISRLPVGGFPDFLSWCLIDKSYNELALPQSISHPVIIFLFYYTDRRMKLVWFNLIFTCLV